MGERRSERERRRRCFTVLEGEECWWMIEERDGGW
jgi:hypothetical protein